MPKNFVEMLITGTLETLYMTVAATLFAYIIGLPLGVLLHLTQRGGLKQKPTLYKILDIFINIIRSAPFLILLLAITPLTKFIVGTSIGSTALIVPLVIASAPYIARLIEQSLGEVDKGVVEAALAMGTPTFKLVYKVLLPEAKPSLIVGAVIATTTILSYSALAGAVGGGGLGDIAIRYGYHKYQTSVVFICLALLVVIVQAIQYFGMRASRTHNKKL